MTVLEFDSIIKLAEQHNIHRIYSFKFGFIALTNVYMERIVIKMEHAFFVAKDDLKQHFKYLTFDL